MSRINLILLGSPRIEHDGVSIKVDTRKAVALMAYVAVAGGVHRRDTLATLLWPEVDQGGVYELLLIRADGGQERRLLSAHLDSRESNLASCTEAALRRSAPQIDFEFVNDVAALAAKSDETLREFWPALLIGVVALLMVEQSLACWFGRAS